MELLEIMKNRRSIRKYTQEPVSEENLEKILFAAMLSASGRGRQPWELIVVQERETLDKMAKARVGAAKMLEGATCAIVVTADPELTDVWTEDCSIAMSNMHLMAASLGVGSCWIQGRLREAENGQSTEEYLRSLLGFPESYKLEAILSLGMPAEKLEAHRIEDLPKEKIHREHF